MKEALNNVLSGSVTYAVRDTHFNGAEIHEGDIIGMLDGTIAEVGQSVDAVALALLSGMIEKKGDDAIVTVFYGENMDEENANALVEAVNEKYPEAECMVQRGGQPLYYYCFSVE